MKRYEILCTPEQTKKALELGAPIMVIPEGYKEDAIHFKMYLDGENASIVLPTAEQMQGWLIEKGILIIIEPSAKEFYSSYSVRRNDGMWRNRVFNDGYFSTRKEATLAAIDAALEYLSNNKK